MGSFLLEQGERIDADKWFKKVAPKNGVLKFYWHPSGDFESVPQKSNCGHGLRYLWAYKDGKRADGWSRSWYFNPIKNVNPDSDNNGTPRYLALWKDGIQIGKQTYYHSNGLPYLEKYDNGQQSGCDNYNDNIEGARLDSAWDLDGTPMVVGGEGKIVSHHQIYCRNYITNPEELLDTEILDQTMLQSYWLIEGNTRNMLGELYIKKALKRDFQDLNPTNIFPFSRNPKRFQALPKMLQNDSKSGVSIAHWTSLEGYQYQDILKLPQRMISYECTYTKGVRDGKELWYEPKVESDMANIYSCEKVQEFTWEMGKLKEEWTHPSYDSKTLLTKRLF